MPDHPFSTVSPEQFERISGILKAMAHPDRLCIIRGLVDHGGCTVGNMADCMAMPQSSLSTHLQKLRAAGIVRPKRKGVEVYYEVVDPMAVRIVSEWITP